MNQLNQLILEGTIKELENDGMGGTNFRSRFKVVSERFYRDRDGNTQKEESDFDVYAFGNLAEMARKNFEKNRTKVRLVGRLKQERWKDEDGKVHSKICVIAEHIEFQPEVKREKKDLEMER